MTKPIIQQLIANGVVIPQPESVFVGDEVAAGRIGKGVVLNPGVRVSGASTSIGAGSVIGSEGPATIANSQLGANVNIGSGYVESSVLLDGSSLGSGAHVRPGCLLEEQSSGAHTVGLKQTVLMSYVTLGSLINFCDCLMSGGTSRKNHSEVGSSYIHFNFTPHQDKATPSLIGDVVQGVFLDQAPIFLGGQGGLVGPARIAFGSIVPAGQIIRRDILDPGRLVVQDAPEPVSRAYDQAVYGGVKRVVENNLSYIGNILALRAWYMGVRVSFMTRDASGAACLEGARNVLGGIVAERVKRLDELEGKMGESIRRLEVRGDAKAVACVREQKLFAERWPELKSTIQAATTEIGPVPEKLAAAVRDASGDYLVWLKGMQSGVKADAAAWLNRIVNAVTRAWI